MNLEPGEAIILFVRRNDKLGRDYFIGVRRSASSFDEKTNDFRIAGAQIPIKDVNHVVNPEQLLPEAIQEFQKAVDLSK